jgi:hypothetical protein
LIKTVPNALANEYNGHLFNGVFTIINIYIFDLNFQSIQYISLYQHCLMGDSQFRSRTHYPSS